MNWDALRTLQEKIGLNNAASGWHERTRELQVVADEQALTDHWVATLSLIATEVAEGIEELRNGHAVDETYYPTKDAHPGSHYGPHKPEGVPSEVADVVIRALDFAARAGFDLAGILEEKLAYNTTRGIRHGGKAL